MRFAQRGLYAVSMLLATGCGDPTPPDAETVDPSPSLAQAASSLPCDESEQSRGMFDVPGPGRPTPEGAVAPYAGALILVAQHGDDGTTVLGMRADETVVRVFDVTKREDGWWPDGYRECSG